MGLYFRKSIRLGPLRFNLSQGGIGVSAGIPGFRVGTGPRGDYVHMGANGIYYRSTLPVSRSSRSSTSPRVIPHAEFDGPAIPEGTTGPTVEIESAQVSQLSDTTSTELLNEIRRKKARPRYLYFAMAGSLIAIWLAIAKLSGYWPLIVIMGAIALCLYVHLRDVIAKTVILFYDFDENMARAFEGLQLAGKHLSTARGFWHVQSQANVNDRRYHAGANSLSSLGDSTVSFTPAPFLRTNVEIFSIPVGKQILYFFPDRLLISDPDGIGAVGYQELSIRVTPTRFIEERTVPSDAEVVDYTWRYLNKNGTPDKRFRDNRQLPICRYSEIHLSTPSGLNEMVMVSNPALAQYFDEHMAYLQSRIPKEGIAQITSPNFI